MDIVKPDYTNKIGYVRFRLYDKFEIFIPVEDWAFMCKSRWFSEEPATADVEAEFGVCGARSARNNEEANEIVQKTINAYKRMMHADIKEDCRELLKSTPKTVARIDKNGHIYFDEAED